MTVNGLDEIDPRLLASCPPGVTAADFRALCNYAMQDAMVMAWLTRWQIGERSFFDALMQIAIHAIRDKGEAQRMLFDALANQPQPPFRVPL